MSGLSGALCQKTGCLVGECGEQQQDIKLPSLFAHILTFAPPVVSLNTTNCPIFSFTVSEIRHLSISQKLNKVFDTATRLRGGLVTSGKADEQ